MVTPSHEQQKQIIADTEVFVKKALESADAAHDFTHIDRVRAMAVRIALTTSANAFVVELVALLHDVYDEKLTRIERTADEIASLIAVFLETVECPREIALEVGCLVSRIGFKKNAFATPEQAAKYQRELTPELAAVQDADTLDAIGAIGIARVFAFGGSRDSPIYSAHELTGDGFFIGTRGELTEAEYGRKDRGSSVGHFFDKLLKLKDRLLTKEGKRIGLERHLLMQEFLKHLGAECVGNR
ncbi:UNVERIFIED_CONTAM: hypothetical protein HDU68_006295 [Siphonaria sp. JEL0065]|nr:hypothetical protein HDU68_006295 [Siphonaria sp. JEL0065]